MIYILNCTFALGRDIMLMHCTYSDMYRVMLLHFTLYIQGTYSDMY